ncbi:ribosome biogenesis protein BRX1 homolog [Hyalella azteca]|uniref:Ribosome biogenesis protein BRX1 homolog n=1 Tax=Hyalella azteca TaxID=294128 RepID=A0A8B7PP55_HYAAZ|nr:ribosome biogenesis protein BRX1 homolog [Hyalella azteca]
MGKRKRSQQEAVPESEEEQDTLPRLPLSRPSDQYNKNKGKWINQQRVLVLCSRGMGARERHLMEDLKSLMPHTRAETKHDTKSDLKALNEVAEIRNCNKVLYFESRKHMDLFMWVSDIARGPSVKFHIICMHTMDELKLSGNCLKGSRPLLKFSPDFDAPHWMLIKELLVQTFGTPHHHPKSQPFFDHVFTFTLLDNKIWFRNYQILEEDGELSEIGPRFVMNPVKILDNSFSGMTLWENPKFKTPSSVRSFNKMLKADKAVTTNKQRGAKAARQDDNPYKRSKLLETIYD